ATAGAFTLTLPAPVAGRAIVLERIDAASTTVTIAGAAVTLTLSAGHGKTLTSDGAAWYLTGRAEPNGTYAPATGIAQVAVTSLVSDLAKRSKLNDLLAPPPASRLTDGTYARTRPLPNNGSAIHPYCRDPNQLGVNGTGRIWAVGTQFAQIGYTDDDGATFVVKGSTPSAALAAQQILITANWIWVLTASGTGPSKGDLYRMPAPDANGVPTGIGTGAAGNQWGTTLAAASNGQVLPQATININNGNYFNVGGGTVTVNTSAGPQLVTYTGKTAGTLTGCTGGTGTMSTGGTVSNLVRVMGLDNLALGPAGAATAGGVNSTFRNSSFAIDAAETHAFLAEYGAANSAATLPAWTDGQMPQYGTRLSSALGTATASHVGLSITVAGAGTAGGTLTATIKNVVQVSGPAIVELSAPAQTAVGAATVTFPSTTYGAGVVVGGPTVYHCGNPTAAAGSVLWAGVKTFLQAKHLHAVKIIGGLPWVSVGDLGSAFPDCGLWVATSLTAPTTWNQRTTTAVGTTPKDPINFFPVTLNGQTVVIGESDSSLRDGPLLFADATGTKSRTLEATCRIPQPYTQTMRSLSPLTTGADPTIMWIGTGEAGSVGPTTCVWMAAAPYTQPIMLEDVGNALDVETLSDPVVNNGFAWFGSFRCVVPAMVAA
ncbi:MAG: hypothetical protein M3256_12285, partial [Actinomycetota bacterium]|nr:hypothetical protein [Actinomycetota bacterium]